MKTTLTSKSTIRAFVKSFELTANTQGQWSAAMSKLEEFLGRVALLKDLNDRTLTAFSAWLDDIDRLAPVTRENYRHALVLIAENAAQQDIVDVPMIGVADRGYSHDVGDDPSRYGLLRYFEDCYLIDRAERGEPLTPETLKSYRAAIRAYLRFAPMARTVNNISPAKIKQFRRWLLDRGMNPKKAGNHAFTVAAIVKAGKPERFVEEAEELTPAADPTRALAYIFEKNYLPAKQSIASEKSVAKYTAVFHSFGRHVGHVATLDDLTDEKIGSYMREIRRNGRATRTANGYRSKLLALWNWCARKRMVENFPTVEKIPEAGWLPTAWQEDELGKLIAGCDRMPGTIAGIPSPIWWRTLHFVSFDTGERTGALLSLTWQMLDAKTGHLAVPAEFRKGGKKPMLYRLKPATLRLLKTMREPERELIFPFPFHNGTFYYRYRLLLKLAGLPYVRYKSALQKMRRSFATHLEAAGGNATEALAHCLRSDTENSYLDPRLIHKTPPNELLFALEATA